MLTPWKESYDQPRQHIKSRNIPLLTKVHIVKVMVFQVVIYSCKSWTIKKAECQRYDAFKLWCWRRLLRVSWTERRSNQSILKEISPEYSLEGLMLKLKIQYNVKSWLTGGKCHAGKDWGQEGKGATEDEMVRWHHQFSGLELGWILGDHKRKGGLECCSPWGCKESDTMEGLNNIYCV